MLAGIRPTGILCWTDCTINFLRFKVLWTDCTFDFLHVKVHLLYFRFFALGLIALLIFSVLIVGGLSLGDTRSCKVTWEGSFVGVSFLQHPAFYWKLLELHSEFTRNSYASRGFPKCDIPYFFRYFRCQKSSKAESKSVPMTQRIFSFEPDVKTSVINS